MADLDILLSIDTVLPGLKSNGMPQLYQTLARESAPVTRLPDAYIYDKLMEQERRDSSGVGGGVAIAHLRLPRLEKPFTILATLHHHLDLSCVDNKPVDLMLLLLSPQQDVAGHLYRLSRFSRLLRQDDICKKLRTAEDSDALQKLFPQITPGMRAA